MNGENGASRDETGAAVQSAIRALRRKLLAPRRVADYSLPIEATNPRRQDRTMTATFTAPTATRIAALAAAILTSTVVLGTTVLGMQGGRHAELQVVALDRVVVTAPAVN
jgi:hypothetical protein